MSFANHLSSNKCTVSTVDPKPKSGPKAGGGPVGFSFNARPNQTWLQSVHFGFRFSRAITAFTPLHIGYSAKQTKHGCFQEESRPFWLQFFTRKQTKNGFNTNLMTKKIGSDMLYRKQKNIEPTTKPNKFELISVNFHTRN